jgi:hypothetical protein
MSFSMPKGLSRAITRQVVPSLSTYRNPDDRELFLSGLRLAAGEET